MYLSKTILALIIILSPLLAGAAEISRLQSSPVISDVTVFPDRAMTSRKANISVKPGSYVVVLGPLPAIMQDDSIRVEGKGSASAVIVGMEVKRTFLEQLPEQRAKEIQDEIKSLVRKSGSVDARKSGLSAQKGFIESIKTSWGERISKELAIGKPTGTELNDALAFVGNGITKVEETTRDLDEEKQQIKDRIDALKRQLSQSIGSPRKEIKTVEVSLDVKREGKLTIEISGINPQAGWEPSYDVRLAPDGKNAELSFRAMVYQQTGEDWNDVNLSLSTARPAVGGTPPEMNPWRISFYRPMPMAMPSTGRSKKAYGVRYDEQADVKAEESTYEPAPPPAPMQHQTALISEEQTSILFKIPKQTDVPSDGARHSSVVAIDNFPVTVEFLAVPKLSPYAFLRSELVNKAPYPILPGKVNIFTGANFTGSSWLKKVASGDKFELFFGTDDQISVKREELKRHKEGGLFGKSKQSYQYRIEASNFRKEPQTIIIRDQLPIAGDEEIKVSLEESSLKPDEIKADGQMTWKLTVKPGEKRELTYGIQVEYPKDREVTGL